MNDRSEHGHAHGSGGNLKVAFVINPSLFSKRPYDPLTDLAPITYAGVTPHTIVVTPALPVTSLKELIAHARKKPGALIDLAFANTPNAVPLVKAGKLRAVAVAHPTRVPQLPDVPTVAEQGFPGFTSNSGFKSTEAAPSWRQAVQAGAA